MADMLAGVYWVLSAWSVYTVRRCDLQHRGMTTPTTDDPVLADRAGLAPAWLLAGWGKPGRHDGEPGASQPRGRVRYPG